MNIYITLSHDPTGGWSKVTGVFSTFHKAEQFRNTNVGRASVDEIVEATVDQWDSFDLDSDMYPYKVKIKDGEMAKAWESSGPFTYEQLSQYPIVKDWGGGSYLVTMLAYGIDHALCDAGRFIEQPQQEDKQ